MRSNIAIKNKLTLVSQMQGESCFQILKYPSLKCGLNLFKDNKENEKTIDEELVEKVNNVYSGIWEVWILPTKSIYDEYMKEELVYNED